MGCCASSPYTKRGYIDPADFDEIIQWGDGKGEDSVVGGDEEQQIGPLRTFGVFRNNSNVIPDDIVGLPSTHILSHIASDAGVILYEAEIDQGRAFNCVRPELCILLPWLWSQIVAAGLGAICGYLNCDQACCWVRTQGFCPERTFDVCATPATLFSKNLERKEYGTRTYFRVYINRIETNKPTVRHPWGYFGCGSWNADSIVSHPFDRGAFGFRTIPSGTCHHLCCLWPVFGGVVARQRCNCNGSLWPRVFSDCGGWWCDECGIAEPDETAFACSIALQAYFEGRKISKHDMDKCLEYWRLHISEKAAPVARKRPVCCEKYVSIPLCSGQRCYQYWSHPKRSNPYPHNRSTESLKEAYDKYERLRGAQIESYNRFEGPVRHGTICRVGGCRRVFGRKGVFFCTEDCDRSSCCSHQQGQPAPPFIHKDIDDDNDAARVLFDVLGDPPRNVFYKRSGDETVDVSMDFEKRSIMKEAPLPE